MSYETVIFVYTDIYDVISTSLNALVEGVDGIEILCESSMLIDMNVVGQFNLLKSFFILIFRTF